MSSSRFRHLSTRYAARLTLAGVLSSTLLWWVSLQVNAQTNTGPFTFVITSDAHLGPERPSEPSNYFQGAVQAIGRLGRGDFMVSTGDLDPPAKALWAITQTLAPSYEKPYAWYPVIGNHDLPGQGHEANPGDNLNWLKSYDYGPVNPGPTGCPRTTYSFDHRNAHFVMLNEYCDRTGPDGTDGDISDHLYDWLANDLRETDKAHVFVFGHEPAYPQPDSDNGRQRHMGDSLNARPLRRNRFWALLRDEGVVAFFCGHTHNYSAVYVDGVWQVDGGHAWGAGDTGAASTFVAVHVDGDTVTYETHRDRHDGEYDYDDIVYSGSLAPAVLYASRDGPCHTPNGLETWEATMLVGQPGAHWRRASGPVLLPRCTSVQSAAPSIPSSFAVKPGYGISIKGLNYSDDSLDKAVALPLEWIKIYDHPPPERLPFKVLYRVGLPRPDEDWAEWGHYRFLDAELYADRIDAYEIGNEPNLIAEWGKAPDPAAYAELLKIAYREIKSADPNALVVTAGLAPVTESDDPHQLNDIAFLRGMYEHGAAEHFDVLGTHLFGFGRPPEMPPDSSLCPIETLGRGTTIRVDGPKIDRGCWPVEGLVFRRAEQMRAIMVEYGDEGKPVWATVFGWMIRPPPCCRTRGDGPAHYWQTVSEGRQAQYIERAYGYAERHWPWMEAMFLWNLDYSRYPHKSRDPGELDAGCPPCDSMGWYSILDPDGSPREAYELLLKPQAE